MGQPVGLSRYLVRMGSPDAHHMHCMLSISHLFPFAFAAYATYAAYLFMPFGRSFLARSFRFPPDAVLIESYRKQLPVYHSIYFV